MNRKTIGLRTSSTIYRTEWNLVLRRDSYSACTLTNSIRSSEQSKTLGM